MIFRCLYSLTLALALTGVAGALGPESARAQTACAATNGADTNLVQVRRQLAAGGNICQIGVAAFTGYDDPTSSAADFSLWLPGDAPVPALGTLRKSISKTPQT